MSEISYATSGAVYATAPFKVKDSSGGPVTGRSGSMTKTLLLNGASSAQVVTITEIGTTGVYFASYTPNALGQWTLIVIDPTWNVAGWQDDIQAVSQVAYDAQIAADALLDRAAAIDTFTPRQIARLLAAALGGTVTNGPDASTFRAADGSKVRITTVTDSNGNRTTVTKDLS